LITRTNIMPKTLCLDIGDRRIGVAVSDASKIIATPLCVIDRKHEDALARLNEIASSQQPDEIVIGMPHNGAGKSNAQVERTTAFAQTLRAVIDLPVIYHDESFSSAEARAIIAGKKRGRQDLHDDAVAASVILQRYLDARRDSLDDFDDFDDSDMLE
jgi:putative Holliday junction resolvase